MAKAAAESEAASQAGDNISKAETHERVSEAVATAAEAIAEGARKSFQDDD